MKPQLTLQAFADYFEAVFYALGVLLMVAGPSWIVLQWVSR